MSKRPLHLVAYDIRHPRRLKAALWVVREFSTGGQKSVHECFLSASERAELLRGLEDVIEPQEDAVLVIRLDRRAEVRTLGIAVPPQDEPFFYVG